MHCREYISMEIWDIIGMFLTHKTLCKSYIYFMFILNFMCFINANYTNYKIENFYIFLEKSAKLHLCGSNISIPIFLSLPCFSPFYYIKIHLNVFFTYLCTRSPCHVDVIFLTRLYSFAFLSRVYQESH